MQVDNQTLNAFLSSVAQVCSKPDYIGWIIGISALILAMVVFVDNRHLKIKIKEDKILRQKRSAQLLSMMILDPLLTLEVMDGIETEMREKGIIPISKESLEEIKKTMNEQKLAEFKQLDSTCTHYTRESKKNIENIEKILNLVYNDLDMELMHSLTYFLQRLKNWEWKSSMYEYSTPTMTIFNPSASTLRLELGKMYDELENIYKK